MSKRFLIGLVGLTLAAGATDVWLSSRNRGASPTPRIDRNPSSPDIDRAPIVVATEDPYKSTVAEAKKKRIRVYRDREASKPWKVLEHPAESGAPLVFLVKKQEDDWLRVLLPIRPNGSKGWIRAKDVSLSDHDYRVVVQLNQHTITVFEGGELLMRRPIGVGRQDAPTPGGEYYIKELLKPPTPNSVYGTYAYGLSGFSNVFRSFNGGEGVIGLHGTNDPSSIGKDVSAGCIRMHNKDIERLVKVLPLGTPVTIVT